MMYRIVLVRRVKPNRLVDKACRIAVGDTRTQEKITECQSRLHPLTNHLDALPRQVVVFITERFDKFVTTKIPTD